MSVGETWSFDDHFEIGADGVARRRRGVVAREAERLALETIPPQFSECSRATWTGPFPVSQPELSAFGQTGGPWAIVALGRTGTGKTTAATIILKEMLPRFPTGGFWIDWTDALAAEKASWNSRDGCELVAALKSSKVILLDDVGAEQHTAFNASFTSEILRYRHRHQLPTIVTSNAATLADLEQSIDGRVLSRFAERTIVVTLTGPDRRVFGAEAA